MSCVVELLHCSGDQCQTDHTTDAPKRGKSCCLGSQASHPDHHAPVEGQLQQQLMTHAWQQLLRQQVDHLQWLERRLSLQSKLTWVALRGRQAESMISMFQKQVRMPCVMQLCLVVSEFVVSMFVVSDCGIRVVCECSGVFVVVGSGSLTTQQRWSAAHNHLLLASQRA